jgi:peptidoglycan/LPS O-acetylase OafA/YrhL
VHPGHVDKSPAAGGRVPEIRSLTGLRIVAALWVVLYHLRTSLQEALPGVGRLLAPVLDAGFLGVDLFFALSGFVLTVNYVDGMGLRLSRARATRFWWARLARVWPAYAVTLLLAGAFHAGLRLAGWVDPEPLQDFSVPSFLRQLALVVQWTEPQYGADTWNGPAWSVSAEALAYLAFPVLALLLFRLARTVRTRTVLWLSAAALLPLLLLVGSSDRGLDYVWLLRLAGSFVAGALAGLVVQRFRTTGRCPAWATALTWLSPAGVLAVLCAAALADRPNALVVAVLFFPPLLIGLSLGPSPLARLLGTRPMVFGGRISYSVYLTHTILVIQPFLALQAHWPTRLGAHGVVERAFLLLVPAAACLTGWVLWRFVEEPARGRMRSMVLTPGTPDAVRPVPGARPAADGAVDLPGRRPALPRHEAAAEHREPSRPVPVG